MAGIRAEIEKDHTCTAAGIKVRARAPVLALCRKLIAVGFDPSLPLHAYRGDVLALKVRSIGEAAMLTVQECRDGKPRYRRWTNVQMCPAVRKAA